MPADIQESSVPLAEISHGPSAFEAFLDRNQKGLVVVAILLAIGTAAFVVYQGIEKSRQETAGEAFNKADEVTSLQVVTTEHAGTYAAQSAMVLLADRQWNDGQQDAAIETLRSFIASTSDHAALPAAQASLGAKLMAQGKNDEAVTIFQSLVDEPAARYIAPYALICMGDIARGAGDLDKAEIAYNRIKADFSDSPFVETATRRIATLTAKPPVEIEPPPAPATEAPTSPGAPPAPTETPEAQSPSIEVETPSIDAEAPPTTPSQATSPETTDDSTSEESPSESNP